MQVQELPVDVLSEVIVRLARPGPLTLSCRAAAAAAAAVRESAPMLGRWAVERFGGADGAIYYAACVKPRDDVLRAVLNTTSSPVKAAHLDSGLYRSIEDGACTPAIAETLLRGDRGRARADPNTAIRPLLHLACAKAGGLGTVRALLDAGAKPDATDQYGMTPLELAQHLGFTEVAELLLANLANLAGEGPPSLDAAAKKTACRAPGPGPPQDAVAMTRMGEQEAAELIRRRLSTSPT